MTDNPIVGHKTFSDGQGGFRHEPIRQDEAEAIWAECEAEQEKRAVDMPTIEDALQELTRAYRRLEELGWRDAVYCPKDGTPFEVIEAGSSGIHKCVYEGEWPKGSWWILDEGDMWPSRPVLFRPLAVAEDELDTPAPEEQSRGASKG